MARVLASERKQASRGAAQESRCRSSNHVLLAEKPSPDFFEGALLGNGGMGVVVCTRPDGVVLHFGHNNVWDIRLAEDNREKLRTFAEIFSKLREVPASEESFGPWYSEYCRMARENYAKPYPRPFPCGSVLLGIDRRQVEILGHRLDVSEGLCEVSLQRKGATLSLQLFVEQGQDRLWMRVVDAANQPAQAPFNRIRLIPDPQGAAGLPDYTITSETRWSIAFQQVLPTLESWSQGIPHPQDRAFRLTATFSDSLEAGTRTWGCRGRPQKMGALERGLTPATNFVACIAMEEGLRLEIEERAFTPLTCSPEEYGLARENSAASWQDFWRRSGVILDDEMLERVWYHNQYFLHCALHPEATCPGLYANWSLGSIGTVWHGDYHFDYNVQQIFWSVFSSNRAEKHFSYIRLVEHLLERCKNWVKEYYGLRGAFVPVSTYPVDFTMNPYPVPSLGWIMCTTPWAFQSLWWHYAYTQSRSILIRIFPLLREAVRFMADYMMRPEAHGPQWGDDKFHIFPTVPPELYSLQPGFARNRDCLADLTLTKFVFRSFIKACDILERGDEDELKDDVERILHSFPSLPAVESREGAVFTVVPGADPEIVQNCPVSLMSIFPGEEHGLHSPQEEFAIAANTYRIHQNEGGNELVFLNLQAARLGLLDLEKFKRQIAYCLLPNGTCTNRLLQSLGRYDDTKDFDYMSRMGIWTENFSLPVVINECLLQSYTGVLRLFPNWPKNRDAEFRTLRAVGAFLVSACQKGGIVSWIEVLSEVGGPLRVLLPWPSALLIREDNATLVSGCELEIETSCGETIRLEPVVSDGC